MARVPYLDQSDLPAEHQDLLARNINLLRAMVHSPHGARAFHGLADFIRHRSRLNPRLRELAILQVGYLTRSVYEYTHHIKIGRDFGVTDDDIRAIAAETAGRPSALEPLARTVLLAAREMTAGYAISNETFAALTRGLDNEQLTDLVLTIAFYNAVVRFLATMQIENEPEYQQFLAEFPFAQDSPAYPVPSTSRGGSCAAGHP